MLLRYVSLTTTLCLISLAFQASTMNSSYPLAGPLTSSIFADPSVIKVNGTYYAYATQNSKSSVPVAKSVDFRKWQVLEKDALPDPGPWAQIGHNESIWAPDVVQTVKKRALNSYA